MCGFVGFAGEQPGEQAALEILERMSATLVHRGPDDSGVWYDQSARIGFGFRRLAILDLSPLGKQPMHSPSGLSSMVFNGEIYNYREIRAELAGQGESFKSDGDTEVLLRALERWGVEKALCKVNGMFALAYWNKSDDRLTLARDRIGIKPLYYGVQGKRLLFGSELKALISGFEEKPEISRDALAMFLRYSYVPAPFSILKGVFKLRAGQFLSLPGELIRSANWSSNTAGELNGQRPEYYWDPAKLLSQHSELKVASIAEIATQYEELLKSSVDYRMISDVPLGAFLSGGIDSSLVVALMQSISDSAVKTFSIGFNEERYNEANHARLVADHLKTDHTELYVSAAEAREVIPKLPEVYCEPFSDSSQIPTYLVSRLARQSVTVALSGDGGDELFAGYNRYIIGQRVFSAINPFPYGLRSMAGKLLQVPSPAVWTKLINLFRPILPQSFNLHSPGGKVHRLGEVLGLRDQKEIYSRLISHWVNADQVVLGAGDTSGIENAMAWSSSSALSFLELMTFADLTGYLPGDILTKVDRASMAHSLEVRVPLLDHRLVEFAWRVPAETKISKGKGKTVLRELLARYIPQELFERPKMGFGVPIGIWLRGPLREWGEELLSVNRLEQEGFFDTQAIRRIWDEHQKGVRDWHYYLWDVLMFQSWLESWKMR